MPRPILAYHLIYGAYGFWLPNEPRGSWSDDVYAPKLIRFGPVTPANTRRSRAAVEHDRDLRREAKTELARRPVRFNGVQARAIARGLAEMVARFELQIYAAAIMPDHVHLVFKRYKMKAETWAGYCKRFATHQLVDEGLHPCVKRDGEPLPSAWAEGGWKVYLHDDVEIERAIRYVTQNPATRGLQTPALVVRATVPALGASPLSRPVHRPCRELVGGESGHGPWTGRLSGDIKML
jgi:REP element-mobilizing transposase RayT